TPSLHQSRVHPTSAANNGLKSATGGAGWGEGARQTQAAAFASGSLFPQERGEGSAPRQVERRNLLHALRAQSPALKPRKPPMMSSMMRRQFLLSAAAVAAIALASQYAAAQETVKIGLIVPMTGQQATTGKQLDAAVKLYQAQNGTTVAGKKTEVILKDDGAVADNTKRIAQDLIVNDKVSFLAGFGVTPAALAAAPLATEAKVPEVVMVAGTSIITERSPYIVRTSFTLAQSSVIIADWAVKNGIKKVVTMVSDYAPGADAEK